jgi:RHS repeat-associated protein
VVQDLRYTYDPVGNITRIEDASLATSGQPVACDYAYDALYRLIAASGREHSGQTDFDFNPADRNYRDYPFVGHRIHPNDLQGLRGYVEHYRYDVVGNILELAHHVGGTLGEPGQIGWRRHYQYALDSNRVLATSLPGEAKLPASYVVAPGGYGQKYGYDIHGNIIRMAHLRLMRWDFKDQLSASAQQVVNNGTPETTYYVYDAAGERARKVTETQAGAIKNERRYLSGYEIYREYSGDNVKLERETLHVMDNTQRIALVETRVGDEARIRYQLGNHLGSASVELDQNGALIAYEEYHPYGTTAFQAGRSAAEVSLKRYHYTGKERDEETGFSYHGARYYAPWLGRWASVDPVMSIRDANRYSYSLCNPVSFYDPDGREPKKYDPFNLFAETDPNPTKSGFNPATGELDPRYFPPPAVHNRQDLEKLRSTSPDRVLGRFAYSILTGLLGVGTASAPTSAAVAEKDRREHPGVGYGEQALNIALAMLPIEKILAYGAKTLGIIGGYEAKGLATTAERQLAKEIREADKFLPELNESFKTGAVPEKEVAKHLAQGNFGERLAAEVLSTEGHRIVSYKPNIKGTNQGGFDIVTLKDDLVYLVDNKALTTGKNIGERDLTALVKNFDQNLTALTAELQSQLASTTLGSQERAVLQKTFDLLNQGKYSKLVTNANFIATEDALAQGVTKGLKDKGIGFLNLTQFVKKK